MTLKILLTGKEIANFQAVKDGFEHEDVTIITATSIALAIFLARKNQPNLIVSQQELIDGPGQAFYAEIKNEAELANIPFIWLSKKTITTQEMIDLKKVVLDIANNK